LETFAEKICLSEVEEVEEVEVEEVGEEVGEVIEDHEDHQEDGVMMTIMIMEDMAADIVLVQVLVKDMACEMDSTSGEVVEEDEDEDEEEEETEEAE